MNTTTKSENPAGKVSVEELNARLAEQERVIQGLKNRCNSAEAALKKSQEELEQTRARTAAIVSAAEDRLYWMDKYYLGPETFEKRRYMRMLVRGLALARRVVAYLRKLRRT